MNLSPLGLSVVAAVSIASAQQSTMVTLTAKADAGVVLAELFRQAKVPFRAERDWGEEVRIRALNVPFQDALDEVVHHADGAYKVDNGVYVVAPAPRTIVAEDESVRDVLKKLFLAVGKSYTVAPEVQGRVSVRVFDVSLRQALEKILDPIGATYRMDYGIYNIAMKQPPASNNPVPPPARTLWNGVRISEPDPAPYSLIVSTPGRQGDGAADVIAQLLDPYCQYVIRPGITGKVSIDANIVDFKSQLRSVLSRCRAQCSVIHGVFFVEPIGPTWKGSWFQ